MATNHILLSERDRLLRQLATLETRCAMGVDPAHAGSATAWRRHRRVRPSPRCVATYVDAVLHALPALAWNESDRRRRERLLPELHDAYANEDLELLESLREQATDRPPDRLPAPAIRRCVACHVAWLVDRLTELADRRDAATGSP
jgi:hypothetical protein